MQLSSFWLGPTYNTQGQAVYFMIKFGVKCSFRQQFDIFNQIGTTSRRVLFKNQIKSQQELNSIF